MVEINNPDRDRVVEGGEDENRQASPLAAIKVLSAKGFKNPSRSDRSCCSFLFFRGNY